jgi:hypothetical protein
MPTLHPPSSLSSLSLKDVNLANFLSQLEKNRCSLEPIYSHIEANIIDTPIKKQKKNTNFGKSKENSMQKKRMNY